MRHAICACLVSLVLSLAARAAEAPSDPVEAVWHSQRLTFQYRSESRMYRCDVLEYKVRRILAQLGARAPLAIHRIACRDFSGAAHLEVIMESPVVATPENIRAITTYSSEDELIAKVRGIALPSAENLERFPAVWQPISMLRAPKIYLEAADCALVQQLRRQILPKMSVQIIKDIDRIDCSQSNPRMTVVALVAAI